MPVTALDPNTALILIDLQQGIVTLPLAHPAAPVIANAAALARAFRAAGKPVVLVNVAAGAPGRTETAPRLPDPLPPGWTDLVPELDPQPTDIRLTKRSWGAFATTDLGPILDALGITQVVIAGISTAIGVESTARQAYEHGFNVTIAVDAMTDTSAAAHAHSQAHIFPRIGETGTTQEILARLKA